MLSRLRRVFHRLRSPLPERRETSAALYANRSRAPDFREHMDMVPTILVDVLGSALCWDKARVLEIGCGPGLTAIALAQKVTPKLLMAIDNRPRMVDTLQRRGRGPIPSELPKGLYYALSDAVSMPFRDASFDLAFAWSVFEHLQDPLAVVLEIKRLLAPGGLLYVQISPLYYSAFGHHFWEYIKEPYAHLLLDEKEIRERILGGADDPDRRQLVWQVYTELNKITVSDLQKLFLENGFELVKAILQNEELREVAFTPALSRVGLQDLATVQINLVVRKI